MALVADRDEILVVDDDGDGRAAYAAVLDRAGYRVREAADGRACLHAVKECAPSLVLLDVSMPGLDGLETLRRLRETRVDVPVILLTGNRLDAASIGVGLELGAEEYLCKPVRPDELTARIRALLKLAGARREIEALKRDQTAMLVHDLKQPLAIIALRGEFVSDEATDPELKRSGEAIRDACRQLERLIESVLELSRVQAGQLRLQRAPCELAELVGDVSEQLRGLAERRGVALAVEAGAPLHASVDGMKITQVLQNLLGNALKFTPSGGRIEVRVERRAGEALVSVEDSGCGLQPGDAATVFDKWEQTRAGRARGGTGLGLAIARAIVEAHGGRIGAGERSDG
ncbi:MAG TPA: response regulator, partial [Polyangia bacterium]|nr:response regulator [Polyangia bacterium]